MILLSLISQEFTQESLKTCMIFPFHVVVECSCFILPTITVVFDTHTHTLDLKESHPHNACDNLTDSYRIPTIFLEDSYKIPPRLMQESCKIHTGDVLTVFFFLRDDFFLQTLSIRGGGGGGGVERRGK